MSAGIGWWVDVFGPQCEKLTDLILGWSEALNCHEQSDTLNPIGSTIEIASIGLERSCKSTERSLTQQEQVTHQIQERLAEHDLVS